MSKRLFVGNLSWNTTDDILRRAFAEGGRNVEDVQIMMDRETGRARGFAFVEMATAEDAQAVIDAWDGQDLDGRPLRVNIAQERRPRSEGGFGGGGGGGGYGGGRPRFQGGGGGRGRGRSDRGDRGGRGGWDNDGGGGGGGDRWDGGGGRSGGGGGRGGRRRGGDDRFSEDNHDYDDRW
ncbi:MAG: RNA-binding protein [Planctomycetota bacterium]